MSLLAAGCAVLGSSPLDLPPGHRAVLGRVDLSRFEVPDVLIEITREDRTFRHDLVAGVGQRDFAIALPPGRYHVARIRLIQDRQTFGTHPVRDVRVTFDVGPDPAVYIGTLRLTSTFGEKIEVAVLDEYEDTVPALRARHPDIAETVARSLMIPA